MLPMNEISCPQKSSRNSRCRKGDRSTVASLRKSGTRVNEVEQDRIDVVDASVGLVGTDDVVQRAKLGTEDVLAHRRAGVLAPAPDDGSGGRVVDGRIARIGDDQDAPGRR